MGWLDNIAQDFANIGAENAPEKTEPEKERELEKARPGEDIGSFQFYEEKNPETGETKHKSYDVSGQGIKRLSDYLLYDKNFMRDNDSGGVLSNEENARNFLSSFGSSYLSPEQLASKFKRDNDSGGAWNEKNLSAYGDPYLSKEQLNEKYSRNADAAGLLSDIDWNHIREAQNLGWANEAQAAMNSPFYEIPWNNYDVEQSATRQVNDLIQKQNKDYAEAKRSGDFDNIDELSTVLTDDELYNLWLNTQSQIWDQYKLNPWDNVTLPEYVEMPKSKTSETSAPSAPTPHGGSEAYPTDQVVATFYDALVDEGLNSGYSDDVTEILDSLDEDTAIRLYLNSLGPEAPQYDSYFDFMRNSSADEKNALMHAVNLLTGQYDQYYDDDGNFLGFWTDDMKWEPDSAEEWLSPEVYSAIVSGLPSARAFAQYLVDSYPKDLKDADIEDLAMELLANSVESKMMSGNRGMDLQTYNDILARLTESTQIPYDVGVYKEGGEYSAHDNAGNVNDWNALLYGETPADRYAAIAANFPGEDTSKANLTTNQDWADWWSQVALANGLAANVNYNKRNSNK